MKLHKCRLSSHCEGQSSMPATSCKIRGGQIDRAAAPLLHPNHLRFALTRANGQSLRTVQKAAFFSEIGEHGTETQLFVVFKESSHRSYTCCSHRNSRQPQADSSSIESHLHLSSSGPADLCRRHSTPNQNATLPSKSLPIH